MRGFLSIVFFANMWQLLLSLLNMSLNALLACFCVEAEWQSYAAPTQPSNIDRFISSVKRSFFFYYKKIQQTDDDDDDDDVDVDVTNGKALRVTSPVGR
jgi:hypothetical protein